MRYQSEVVRDGKVIWTSEMYDDSLGGFIDAMGFFVDNGDEIEVRIRMVAD